MSRTAATALVLLAPLAAACDDAARPEASPRACLAGGTFEMGTYALDPCGRFEGTTALCRVDETSERAWHRVYLTPYFLDTTEVTNAQYADCVAHGPCTKPARTDAGEQVQGTWARFYTSGTRYDAYPVVNVSHAQAQTYCAWRGGRLPTEAEWEMAARGEGGRATDDWVWGDSPDPVTACRTDAESVAFGQCARGFPWPVGAAALDRRAGVRDLMGNVAEWVLDAWDPLAFCDEASRALYGGTADDAVNGMPPLRSPATLDANCAGLPDCLAACDAERFWCAAACETCADRTGGEYGDCQVENYCAQACRQPTDCDCATPEAERSPDCQTACLCLPTCRGVPFPPADAPASCLRHCYDTAEDRCRERGCLKSNCRTFCGDVLRESNRLCQVRTAPGGTPVEVPVVLDAPQGLAGYHVVKGGDYLISEEDACVLRIGRRVAGSEFNPRIGFRCAFDAEPGRRDCEAQPGTD